MSKSSVEIHSKVNELYIKTKITQKLKNETDNPLELKIYVYKNTNSIFSSFSAQIGDSILVKSKVIKKKKAEEKYSDSIASGNSAIFVSVDPYNSYRIIINMGNIPPKQEVLFISEFIQFTEVNNLYEFELFRNLPIFGGKDSSIFQNEEIKGIIELNTKNKIIKIDKNILSDKLNIIEEKYLDENKYILKYEYKNLGSISLYGSNDYIPSNKISFETIKENKEPIAFCQSFNNENENNYIIQYKNNSRENKENIDDILNPALFIFLLDQSGSMSGYPMDFARKALILFLQSLPAGSYYQIIGFGSTFEKYDKTPKKYTQNNIKKSIKFIENLNADLGGTDIYSPLKDIYSSIKEYNKIKLPKNIFLLTDGEIENKKMTLNLIEENSNEFFIYSIGIGNYFDRDLIKNASILGKGYYEFCTNIKDLNEIIVKELKNASKSFYSDFEFNSNLDENNLYKLNDNKLSTLADNQIVNMKYVIKKKEIEKIKLNIKYKKYNKPLCKIEDCCEKYELNISELNPGEELSKLIINEYLIKNKDLTEEEKTNLALRYQIFTDYTSLFAEVELSEKITEEMKKEIIGDEENNVICKQKPKQSEIKYMEEGLDDEDLDDEDYDDNEEDNNNNLPKMKMLGNIENNNAKKEERDILLAQLKSIDEQNSILESISKNVKSANINLMCMNIELKKQDAMMGCIDKVECVSKDYEDIKEKKSNGGFFKSIGNSIKGLFSKKNKDDDNIDKNNKKELDIKDIIDDQNFVEGYWELNENTKRIKMKYENEFKLLKKIKNNINDNIAITILIIYFINKEHSELLNEYFMIIQKAKNYIKKNTNDTYESIIKEIGIN